MKRLFSALVLIAAFSVSDAHAAIGPCNSCPGQQMVTHHSTAHLPPFI